MKRNKFPYKKGSIIEVYVDHQTCREIEGMGRLLKFISHGLPFILEETRRHQDQIVFSYQVWLVDMNGFRTHRKIRYVKGIGNYSSMSEEPHEKLPKDSFLSVNNKQVF